MRKFIKIIGCIMLCSTFLLCGCSKNSLTSSVGKKVITIWSIERHDMNVRAAQIEKFNKENKDNIEIKFEVKADGMDNMLQLAYQSCEAPDIHSHLSGGLMKAAVEGNWIRELPEKNIERYKNDYVKGSLRYYPGNQKPYSVASSILTYKLIWNKDLFAQCGLDPEKAPKTWDEVINNAKIITQKGNGQKYGFALPMKDNFGVLLYINNPSAASGSYTINGFNPKTNSYDFKVFKPMLNVMLKMKENGSLFPTPDTLNNDMARAQFAEGNVGMMIAATYDIGVYNEQFPAKIEFGVTDYPTFDGTVKPGGGYLYDIAGSSFQMNASSKYPDEQLKVFDWLISEEVLKELSLEGKGVYSHKAVFNNPDYVPKDKKGAIELSTFSKPQYVFPSLIPNQLVKIEGQNYSQVFGDIICFDSSNIDIKLEKLNERYNAAYQRLGKEFDISIFANPDYDPNASN